MFTFQDVQQKIEREIARIQFVNPPKSLYEPIVYTLSLGGKRIRPALLLMACNLYQDEIESAMQPALGLEVFHNFTLLHDDLMDEADMRRNQPTVHKRWSSNAAILSGDAMLIYAYRLFEGVQDGLLKPVLQLFTTTALEICAGQQFDMEFETRQDVTEAEYIEMIRLKTAVLLACALKMGAMLGKAPEVEQEVLYRLGIHMGLAFQLQDDLLDVYGDTAVFGKQLGGDIVSNKKTFLLINALQRATGHEKAVLTDWISRKTFNPEEKIAAVTQVYDQLGLKELTEDKIQVYYKEAMDSLGMLNVPTERLAYLKEVCTRLMYRQS